MLRAGKRKQSGKTAPKDRQKTRKRLLLAAAQEIHESGFRGTDLQTILNKAGVTKGALYHYFESKEALGYAIVEEPLTELTREKWQNPLKDAEDPLDALAGIVRATSLKPEHVRRGCPLNNLAQEMSSLDEGFRTRLERVFRLWRVAMADALREGRKRRLVRSDVNPEEAASFLLATYEGYMSLAKNSQDARVLKSGVQSILRYLETLRPAAGKSLSLRAE